MSKNLDRLDRSAAVGAIDVGAGRIDERAALHGEGSGDVEQAPDAGEEELGGF